jgi:hypothetical protein
MILADTIRQQQHGGAGRLYCDEDAGLVRVVDMCLRPLRLFKNILVSLDPFFPRGHPRPAAVHHVLVQRCPAGAGMGDDGAN